MKLDRESLQQQIPYYLTSAPEQKALLTEITSLIAGAKTGYFIPYARDPFIKNALQGDGWTSFKVIADENKEDILVKGIILSNSCDISPDNTRATPSKVNFSPLIKLAKFEKMLIDNGQNSIQIKSRMQSIREQRTTNIFYVPAGGQLKEEYIALLDNIHSTPMASRSDSAEKTFTLSMAGFYIFIFKLSVHFCRLHENSDRKPST